MSKNNKYYAVRDGRNPGVYNSWADCKDQTNGYSNAQFKSFATAEEANDYMSGHSSGHSSGGYSSGGSYYVDEATGSYGSSSAAGRDSARLVVYTDGACPNNGFGGARGGMGVHFPDHPDRDISEPLSGRQTNNRAEIGAARRALEVAKSMGRTQVEIRTDSAFLKQSVEEWVPNWKRNGWTKSDGTAVQNKEDLIALERAAQGMDVKYTKVAAHSGIAGNERADRLANEGVAKNRFN